MVLDFKQNSNNLEVIGSLENCDKLVILHITKEQIDQLSEFKEISIPKIILKNLYTELYQLSFEEDIEEQMLRLDQNEVNEALEILDDKIKNLKWDE